MSTDALQARPSSRADEAVFRPVRSGNAFEDTVERILQAIKLGVTPPGERLPPERELAARLNVSRVTLREAIKALAEAGYVESRRGRYGGTFVSEMQRRRDIDDARPGRSTESDLEDVLVLRFALEVGAAESAASANLTQRERQHLCVAVEDCSSAPLAHYRRLDSRLHLAIAEVTGSASLTAALADVRMRINDLLDAIPLLERNLQHSNLQHAKIVQSILDGDPDRARRTMAEHLSGTTALLRGFLG